MSFMVDNEAFRSLPETTRIILRVKFADADFKIFLKSQIEAQKRQIAELDPEGKSPEVFYQTAKDMRLVLQFWMSFLDFAEDWGNQQ